MKVDDVINSKVDERTLHPYIKNKYPEILKMNYNDANSYLISKVFYGTEQLRKLVYNFETKKYDELSATPNNPEKGFIADFYKQCSYDEKLKLIAWYTSKLTRENGLKDISLNIVDRFNKKGCDAYHYNYLIDYGINHSIIFVDFEKMIVSGFGLWTMTAVTHELKHYADTEYYNNYISEPEKYDIFHNLNYLKDWKFGENNYTINSDYIIKIIEKSLVKNGDKTLLKTYSLKQIDNFLSVLYLTSPNEKSANLYAIHRQKEFAKKYQKYLSLEEKTFIKNFEKNLVEYYFKGDEIFKSNSRLLTYLINNFLKIVQNLNLNEFSNKEKNNFLNFYAIMQLIIDNPAKKYDMSDIDKYLKSNSDNTQTFI